MDNLYLIVSDVDGTLAYDAATISAGTKAAVNRLLAAGHLFYLATGRMYNLAALMAAQIGPGAEIIAANGAVYDFGGSRVHHLLGEPAITAIEAACAAHDLAALYFTDDMVYYTTPPAQAIQDMLTHFAPASAQVGVEQLEAAALGQRAGAIANAIVFSLDDPVGLAAVAAKLKREPALAVSASDPTNLELIPHQVDKANAIAELQAKTGIPPARTIAFGDGLNDLGMLQAAGISVAMGNAVPAVKAAARYQTVSNKEDGVAQFLNHFFA
ncbi:Cof-type HAD-IIB family hydrolase [Lacticaseibacillus parakribbianus]|uniref:Cof-type HAD-IIB family hydrolase n=1 Tax=Lacticaseibacillus parakribbianus TaxID=2970927 RepID=UPI0021CB9692|nr:Cof-type HAD-IIB family hydrolase [Lacticaseibacillus parakribbianus]